MPIRVSANGSASPARIAAGITYAVDRGARIINVSLSHAGSPDAAEAAAVKYAIDRDVVVVASAGNAGTETPQYPGAYPGVLAVGASDDLDELYFWSSRGAVGEPDRPGLPDGRGRDDAAGDDLRHLVHARGCRGRRGPTALTEPGPHRESDRRGAARDRPAGGGRRLRAGRSRRRVPLAGAARPHACPGCGHAAGGHDAAGAEACAGPAVHAGRRSSRRARSGGGSARRSGSGTGDSRCSCSHRSRAPAHSRSTRRASSRSPRRPSRI